MYWDFSLPDTTNNVEKQRRAIERKLETFGNAERSRERKFLVVIQKFILSFLAHGTKAYFSLLQTGFRLLWFLSSRAVKPLYRKIVSQYVTYIQFFYANRSPAQFFLQSIGESNSWKRCESLPLKRTSIFLVNNRLGKCNPIPYWRSEVLGYIEKKSEYLLGKKR